MNTKNTFKVFFQYTSLNILGQMAYSCYTLADTFFVSAALGANGLTALNLAFPMFCLMNGIGLMIGMGGGTGFSILQSRGESRRANLIFTNAFFVCAACSILFVLLGLFSSGALARALGADDTVFSMTDTYLRVMLLFAPAFMANNLLQCFVRNDGAPSRSTLAMIVGSASNVVLDYIFIFPLDMGIFGAIFATGLSPIISIFVLSPYFINRKNRFHLVRTAPVRSVIMGVLSSGAPSLVTEVTSGVVMLLFNFIILRLAGNVGVAAFGVISVISLVVVAIYTGLSQGVQPVLSASCGKGDVQSVKALHRYAIAAAVLLSCVIYSAIYRYAPQIAAVFNAEQNDMLQRLAVTGMKWYFLACPLIGYNIVTATYFTSTENPRPAQILSLLRGIIILIPMAFLLAAAWGMQGVWCAYPATECVAAMIGTCFYIDRQRNGKNKPAHCQPEKSL